MKIVQNEANPFDPSKHPDRILDHHNLRTFCNSTVRVTFPVAQCRPRSLHSPSPQPRWCLISDTVLHAMNGLRL